MGRATDEGGALIEEVGISIHALRGEGDKIADRLSDKHPGIKKHPRGGVGDILN